MHPNRGVELVPLGFGLIVLGLIAYAIGAATIAVILILVGLALLLFPYFAAGEQRRR